eukprot:scaffold31775_cov79-Cyclotella_meneghiniana.AAC.13
MTRLTTLIIASLLSTNSAFTTPSTGVVTRQCSLNMAEEPAFVADPVAEEKKEDESTFDAVEKMGRGAAKNLRRYPYAFECRTA